MTEHAWPPITRDAKSGPFFDAAARDELLIKHCDRCAQAAAPDAAVCPGCGGIELSWVRAAGTATLVSWTVVHRAPNRAYTDLVPYTVGIVELTEGPWLHTRVDTATPSAGMPLRAGFVHADGSESHPIFTAGV